jgi:hypothetical protein
VLLGEALARRLRTDGESHATRACGDVSPRALFRSVFPEAITIILLSANGGGNDAIVETATASRKFVGAWRDGDAVRAGQSGERSEFERQRKSCVGGEQHERQRERQRGPSSAAAPASAESGAPAAAPTPAPGGASARSFAYPTPAPAASPAPIMAGTASTSELSVDDFGLIPTVDGPLGLFTVSSGNVLPRHGWSVEGYANRFGRMPGELVVTDYGLNIGFGLTNWAEIYVDDIPDAHIKAGDAFELTPLTATGFHTTHAIYSEDFPFVSHTEGGEGPFTVGMKFGLVSEDRGDPVSVSFNADIDISTRQDFAVLERSGTQNGKANFEFGTSVSKNVSNIFTFDFDATIDLVRARLCSEARCSIRPRRLRRAPAF